MKIFLHLTFTRPRPTTDSSLRLIECLIFSVTRPHGPQFPLSYFVRCGGLLTLSQRNGCKGGKPISSFSKAFFFIIFIVGITWFTYKTTFRSRYLFFLCYFADSSIYRRGCPCSAFGNLSPCVFHERREDRWRDVGGNWSAVVLHHAGDINHFFCLEDRTWKPRNPGETNKVWGCSCLSIITSWSAKVERMLLNDDTSWYLTLSRIWISQ